LKILDGVKEEYGKILVWSLTHKRWVLIAILILFVGAFSLLPAGFIGSSFAGNGDRGELTIQLELSPQTPLSQTNLVTSKSNK
jgi:HAE1 family hydrophobic/amphiphilic exporter-1